MVSDTQGRDPARVQRAIDQRNATNSIQRATVLCAPNHRTDVWVKLLSWQIAWENEILRYLESNNQEDKT